MIEDIQATRPSVAARLAVLVDGSTPQHRQALDILASCLDASVSPKVSQQDDCQTQSTSDRSVDLDETQELSDASLSCSASPVLLGSTLVADW